MRAGAHVVAVADKAGRTHLAVLRGEGPLLPRWTNRGTPGPAQVHFVAGAAGPLGGDEWRIDIEVGTGAQLIVRTVAATVALPGNGQSHLTVHARLEGSASLEWLPEPVIAAAGCHYSGQSIVDLAATARLTWREELVWGRHGEDGGRARQGLAVQLAGAPLYRNELSIGPGAPGWRGPAVLGDARAVGSVLVVDPGVPEPPAAAVLGPTAARMPLAGPGVLTVALGDNPREVRAQLDAAAPLAVHSG